MPLFLLIGVWGARTRKVYAAYQFFVYTLLGSVLVIFAILSIFFTKGTATFEVFSFSSFFPGRYFLL